MSIGIKGLAEHLNLSIGTVSRALNDRPDVNPETRKRVGEAALALGYVPNQSGRSLRRGQTGVIAFMMETGHEITGQGDAFFMSIFDGVQTVLGRHHLDLVALLCPSDEDAGDYLKRMVSRGIADGIIISSTKRIDPRIDFLASRGVPFVTLGRSSTDAGQPWIDIDFEAMARQAIDRLVARGHERIAVTVPDDDANLGHVFLDSARQAHSAHGLVLDPELALPFRPNEAGGYAVAGRLLALPERPTAVVLLNPSLAAGLYRGLSEAGVRPGRDIAVIGRESPQSPYLSPSLTRFREDLFGCGMALCEALLASMPRYADIYPTGTIRRIWPTELIDGESDAFRAGR
ncbi:LacI family DNA-binding transcriptional regulator [Solirhodobacter olei]|uniref:LacI family DNA-binding transcriptional regulator n=1 Tax=Solirhodobacter olei TaxID=2493082 RepID=UPI000FD965E5|nr:LacI family DNA-binding transcriptional regulator [Solirhodobacter olei]